MKTNQLLLALFMAFLLTGCAPRVVTHVTKSYPANVPGDAVRLYEVGQELPPSAEVIGNVSVKDNGFSTRCNYEQVVSLAIKATAKNGGNALALTKHQKPSPLWSSCHQISGDMLRLSDSVSYQQAPVWVESDRNVQVNKKPHQFNTIYANIGYAFITTKFSLPAGASGNPKNGLDWQIGYDWVSRSGFGAGLLYSGYKSSYHLEGYDIHVGLTYIAPQFVIKQSFDRWIFQENIGLGYFGYRESLKNISENLSGVGVNLFLGIEYLLSKHVGIGANLGYLASRLAKQDSYEYEDGEYAGISRFTIDAGIRFHF